MKHFWSAVGVVAAVATLGAQVPAQQGTRFRIEIALVSTDVIVRDGKGQFVSDLSQDDFELYEDGIKQELSSMTLVHGGRVTNLLAPPPPPIEGVVLPAARPVNTSSGRVFLFVVDDFHLDVHKTPVIRDLFDRIGKNLLHEGDLFSMVSTGTSAIALDLTYDRQRFDDSVNRIMGNGLSPLDIIQGHTGAEGPIEVRYRAQVAFMTVNDSIAELGKVRDRRKIVVYVSNGYDLSPFLASRSGTGGSTFTQNYIRKNELRENPLDIRSNITEGFSDARLAQELQEMTELANRVNATIYTIDPRGLIAAGDIGDNVNPREWRAYVTKSQDALRVIAAETGGIAVINRNGFDDVLKEIDAAASDYYVLGYYADNPDPSRRVHKVEVRVKRQGVNVWNRETYTDQAAFPPPPPAQ